MLARGAAAEVAAGDQDAAARAPRAGSARNRARRAGGVVAPVGEQMLARARRASWCVRKRAGMIWSVSMLAAGRTTVRERKVLMGSMRRCSA